MEPTMVRWALVRVCSSTFPCTLTLPSSWYRFICLSWEERLSSRPAEWIPDQAGFPLILCLYSRVIADIRNIRESAAEHPCSADWRKCQAQRGWPGLSESNLSITSCGSQPMWHWIAEYSRSFRRMELCMTYGLFKGYFSPREWMGIVLKSFCIIWPVRAQLNIIFL